MVTKLNTLKRSVYNAYWAGHSVNITHWADLVHPWANHSETFLSSFWDKILALHFAWLELELSQYDSVYYHIQLQRTVRQINSILSVSQVLNIHYSYWHDTNYPNHSLHLSQVFLKLSVDPHSCNESGMLLRTSRASVAQLTQMTANDLVGLYTELNDAYGRISLHILDYNKEG